MKPLHAFFQLFSLLLPLGCGLQDNLIYKTRSTFVAPAGILQWTNTTAYAGSSRAYAGLELSDGSLMAVGSATVAANIDFGHVHYLADGTLDTAFGTGGKINTPLLANGDVPFVALLQPDGKIVSVGDTNTGATTEFALMRHYPNGSLDTSFGTGGKAHNAILGTDDRVRAALLQPDGKIVALGWATGGNQDMAIARYLSDGSLDTSFGTGGMTTLQFNTGIDIAYAGLLQPDGKIIAVGTAYIVTKYNFALARFNPDGSLDTTFGTAGKVLTAFGTGWDQANAALLQPDGKIVAVGQSNNGSNDDFALARYNTDGSLDTSFGTGGKVTTAVLSALDRAYTALLQPDGSIVAAGEANNGIDSDFALLRYLSNGSLDTSFGTQGKLSAPVLGADDFVNNIILLSTGKILAVGGSYDGTKHRFGVAQFR